MTVEGGVFVSKEVHDQLANQKEFEGVSLGLQSMKGVGRLIEVYAIKGDKLSDDFCRWSYWRGYWYGNY